MTALAQTLRDLRRRCAPAHLIAVSKTRSVEDIRQALAAGQRAFGENRVQEAQSKFPALREAYPDLELHLIGALQTNKARAAVALFDVIQTLDRPALADALAQAIRQSGRAPRLYIEINSGNEPQKAGIAPHDVDDFLRYCRETCGLAISGVMCIPPHDQDPRPFFTELCAIAHRLNLPHISMGMSGDFETAVACGATEVRIGTALFGIRDS